METLLIFDIHGRIDIVRKILAMGTSGQYRRIWCGDLVDSFDESIANQAECLESVLRLCQKSGRDELLLGNHEASYLFPNQRCSGWNKATQAHIDVVKRETAYHTKLYKLIERENDAPILITHAGVSQTFLPEDLPLLIESITGYLDKIWGQCNPTNRLDPLFLCGRARGGMVDCGGPIWCDFDMEFHPIPGIVQVFGHSHRSRHHPEYILADDKPYKTQPILTMPDNNVFNIGCGICMDVLGNPPTDRIMKIDEQGQMSLIKIGD